MLDPFVDGRLGGFGDDGGSCALDRAALHRSVAANVAVGADTKADDRRGRSGPDADVAAWQCSVCRNEVSGRRAQVVRIPSLQARPLGDGTSIDTVSCACLSAVAASRPASPPTSPAARRPSSRATVAVIHRLDAAPRRPVSLEDLGSLSQVANDVHHAHPASNQEGFERVLGPSTKASPSP